jgi:hypothetical protein
MMWAKINADPLLEDSEAPRHLHLRQGVGGMESPTWVYWMKDETRKKERESLRDAEDEETEVWEWE